MSNNLFSEEDKKYVLDLVKDEWDLLHREPKEISLLLVKRSEFKENHLNISEFLNSEEELFDVVDSLLSPKKSRIISDDIFSKEKITIITLDSYYMENKQKSEEEVYQEELEKYKLEEENKEFMDTYGSVSILLIAGSILITLGVIITIFMLIRGI